MPGINSMHTAEKVNNRVVHKKFGKGVIMGMEENRIYVCFDENGETKVFPYPKAFENYLSYEDESLQANVSKTIGVIREEESDALRRRNAEYEALEKERIRERKAMLKKKRDAKTAAAAADIRARKKIEDAVNAKLAKQRETGCRKG